MISKSYAELIQLLIFEERYHYLRFYGALIGDATFGSARFLNQQFYRSKEWKSVRDQAIIRDGGFDLAHQDYPINGTIHVHHINPITEDDIIYGRPCLYDLDNLICVSILTHNALHFGDEKLLPQIPVERTPGDTTLWR